ncbi:MAG: redoxin domain-containing protein [Acidimicrobiia bacterium]|nr:redoxin domain-containing protein [Acidimicrobiia bacterium]
MRRAYPDIAARGADVVAIGTGDVRYARAFVEQEQIPFLVLVDDDASAARAASVRKVNFFQLLGPGTWGATRKTWREGYRIHKSGRRVNQLGATFVIGPGPTVHYEHVDGDSTDHAPLDDVIARATSPHR